MTDLQKAAEIKTWSQRCDEHPDHEGIVSTQMIMDRMQEEIDELRQALAQPEQEKYVTEVVAMHKDGTYTTKQTPLPKREWVSLTNEEIDDLWKTEYFNLHYEIARAIEAKLKEKNV